MTVTHEGPDAGYEAATDHAHHQHRHRQEVGDAQRAQVLERREQKQKDIGGEQALIDECHGFICFSTMARLASARS